MKVGDKILVKKIGCLNDINIFFKDLEGGIYELYFLHEGSDEDDFYLDFYSSNETLNELIRDEVIFDISSPEKLFKIVPGRGIKLISAEGKEVSLIKVYGEISDTLSHDTFKVCLNKVSDSRYSKMWEFDVTDSVKHIYK